MVNAGQMLRKRNVAKPLQVISWPRESAVPVFPRRQVGQHPFAGLDPAATVFDVHPAVVDDFQDLVHQVFSQTIVRQSVPASKFPVAGEPAEYSGSGRHRGIGTDGPEAFALGEPVADRFSDLGAVAGRTAVFGLILGLHAQPRVFAPHGGTRPRFRDLVSSSFVGLISNCGAPGGGGRAPECLRSVRAGRVGCLNQGLNLPNLFSHDPTDRFGLARVEPAPEVSVPLASRTARTFGATVHATPASTSHSRLPAGVTGTGLRPASAGSSHVRQSPRNVRLTHGVVCHFSPSPSRSFPAALTIPTTPWAPEWMWRCRTSTVCWFPRRCRSRAWIMSSCSRRSLTA